LARGGARGRRGRGGARRADAAHADPGCLRGGRERRDDAAEEHVLLSQARLGPPLPSTRAMTTDWLTFCRSAVEDLQVVFARLPSRVEREPVLGMGVGGDETTAVDAEAEAAVVARLEQLHGEQGV